MKRRRDRISAVYSESLRALVFVVVGILIAFFGMNPCPGCYGPPYVSFIGTGLALIGVVIGVIALILAVRDALEHGDRVSGFLLMLCNILSIGALVYVDTATAMSFPRLNIPLTPLDILLWTFPLGWNIPVYAAPAAAALLYSLLRNRTYPLHGALGGLAAFAVIAIPIILLLVGAPLLSAFQASHRPPALQISGAVGAADCVHGMYPSITLQNVGDGTLRWTAKVNYTPGVTIQPSSGSIGPGRSQTVMLAGDYFPTSDTGQGVNVSFASNGGNQSAYVNCQTPSSMLRVTPTSITTTPQDVTLPLITVTNIGQDDARWSATTTELGITISPQSGSLHPGQSQAVAVYGDGGFGFVCGNAGHPPFTILFNGAPQPLTVTVTVTCT